MLIVLSVSRISELSLMLLGTLWGGMAFPLYSVAVALTNDHVGHAKYVKVSSGLLLLYGIGAVAGPLLAALVMSALGPGGLYLFSGAVHLSLFGYVGIRTLKRVPVQTELRSDFGEALASAQTASDVYETDDDDEGLPDTA